MSRVSLGPEGGIASIRVMLAPDGVADVGLVPSACMCPAAIDIGIGMY